MRPTVSLRCHSTDVTNGFGPGTSRRCRARVFYRRGRGRTTGVPAGCATGVPGAVGPARTPSTPRASLGASARSPARPRPRRRSPHWWRVVPGQCLRSQPYPLPGLIWIGCGHVDRLLSYPDARYLSGCCLPIRMCVGGRGSRFLYGRNRGCLHVAAELPATRSLTRVCTASSLVAQWSDITEVVIAPVWRWCHPPSLV